MVNFNNVQKSSAINLDGGKREKDTTNCRQQSRNIERQRDHPCAIAYILWKRSIPVLRLATMLGLQKVLPDEADED